MIKASFVLAVAVLATTPAAASWYFKCEGSRQVVVGVYGALVAKYGLPEHPDPAKNEATVVVIYSENDDGPDVFIFPADGRNLQTPEIVSNGVQTPGFRWNGSETATLGRKKCKAL
jgi:hypothetical protein